MLYSVGSEKNCVLHTHTCILLGVRMRKGLAHRGAVGVVYEHTRVQFSALVQSGSAHAHSAIIPNCAEPEAMNCMASFSFGCDAAPLF